ncbi:MAG: single-stranded DNA-binding protein [Planctomycetes bacterium]|nr:single-stranded DNA-binding protein [Planctomycetota bacterium]
MAINEARIDGTIYTDPRPLAENSGIVEFILCHQHWDVNGTVLFIPVEMYEALAEMDQAKKGKPVLVIGKLVEKQWIDSTTGEVRSAPRLRAVELKDLKPSHN